MFFCLFSGLVCVELVVLEEEFVVGVSLVVMLVVLVLGVCGVWGLSYVCEVGD